MPYGDQKHIKIDLSELEILVSCPKHEETGFAPGCADCQETPPRRAKVPVLEGYFVEILNPALLPWGERKEALLREEGTGAGAMVEQNEKLVARLITSWNLEDPETGDPLELPKNDPESLSKAPSVVGRVLDEYRKGGVEIVPKETATA